MRIVLVHLACWGVLTHTGLLELHVHNQPTMVNQDTMDSYGVVTDIVDQSMPLRPHSLVHRQLMHSLFLKTMMPTV